MHGTSLTSAWSAAGLVVSGRRRGEEQIDLIVQDQFGRDFRRASAARLAVPARDLDRVGFAADRNSFRQDAAHLIEDEAVGLAKTGERAGLWADMPDPDGSRLRIRRNDAQHRWRRQRAETARSIPRDDRKHFCFYSCNPPCQRPRMALRCCTTLARNAACCSGLHLRKPSPDLNPSLPLATSPCR